MGLHDDALLEALGSTWDGPPDLDSLAEPAFEAAFAELEDPAVPARVAFPKARPVVWKDPRACLLLPYWLAHLPKPVAAVFIWRSPLSVARSLQVRNGMAHADGVALWERYNRCGLTGLVGTDTFVANYDSMVEDPSGMVGSIATWLGDLPQFAPYAPEWDVGGAAASISPTLNRQRVSGDSETLLAEQRELRCHLETLTGPHHPFMSPPPGAESAWTTAMLHDRRHAASLQREIDALKRILVERDRTAETLAADAAEKVDASRVETERQNAAIQRLEAEKVEMQTQLTDIHELYTRMRASMSWRVTRPLRRVLAFLDRMRGTAT